MLNSSSGKLMFLRFTMAAAVMAAFVAACTSGSPKPSTSPSATAFGVAVSPVNIPFGNQPSGTVTLKWDPQTKNVAAKLQMIGFTPGSSHAMYVHQGSCAAPGGVLVPFPDVTANAAGDIATTVTSSQPSATGLAAGTVLKIHLGSTAQQDGPGSLGDTPISCADITPAASTTLTMRPPPQPGQHPQGSAQSTYDPAKKTLSVAVTASGLVAGSAHAQHIHLGSCDSQGAVKYPLDDLVASAAGTAQTTTVIQNVDQAPPASGWYLNVHLGSSSEIQQNGQPTLYFQPILCGNIAK